MKALSRNQVKAAQIAKLMRAIAHPSRLRIVAALCKKPNTVNELADELGIPPVIISQQLRILRNHHLVKVSRRGLFAHYSLGNIHLKDLICCMERCRK